jgi:phi13 family phage major tail protein
MNTKNLKYFVYAIYFGGAYSNGAVLAKAISAEAKYNFDNAEIYADGALQASDYRFTDGTLSISTYGLTYATRAALLGHAQSSPEDGMTANVSDIAPYVGVGFYGVTADDKYLAIFYPKVQFRDPADSLKTREKSTQYTSPTLEGQILKDDNGVWIKTKVFNLEADATSWLKTQAGISDTPSAGLSALSLSGTGGTLSPAFSTSVRYYTFGGLTGTSFTVTATAAGHTIQMYVNDAFVQNLTSGSPSAAVSMASTGTKKVKIVAYESGKASQTTEIIVVKTA